MDKVFEFENHVGKSRQPDREERGEIVEEEVVEDEVVVIDDVEIGEEGEMVEEEVVGDDVVWLGRVSGCIQR